MINDTIFDDLLGGLVSAIAYCGVGLAILVIGVVIVDLLTPGKLTHLIYTERNWNAGIIVAANIIAVGTIVVTSIVTSDNELARGLADAAGYGLLGIVALAIAFVVLDRLTPGHLGHLVTDATLHPAILVTAATTLVIGGVVSAAIA